MLGRGVTIFPDNLAVGTAGEETFAYKQGLIEARELRRLGVDLNLGPCLDVLTDRYSPNIGIRSYGKDPKLVARYGVARLRGMTKGGLSACEVLDIGHDLVDGALPNVAGDALDVGRGLSGVVACEVLVVLAEHFARLPQALCHLVNAGGQPLTLIVGLLLGRIGNLADRFLGLVCHSPGRLVDHRAAAGCRLSRHTVPPDGGCRI